MNITKREWELAMESESNREMAMRILESPKAAEAAVQRAECRMQNEGAAEATMQNAKPLGSNGEAMVKPLGSNGEAMEKQLEPSVLKVKRESDYAFWEKKSERNAESKTESEEATVTEFDGLKVINVPKREGGSAGGRSERPQNREEASCPPNEEGSMKFEHARMAGDHAELRAVNKVLNAELRTRKPDYAFWEGHSNQSAESKMESEEATVTDIEGLKVYNVPRNEAVKQLGSSGEAMEKRWESGMRKEKREPDYAFWEEGEC